MHAAACLSFSSKPLYSLEDNSFLVFGGTTRLLGLVVDCGGTWEAYPWHRLNSRCEPEDVNKNLGEFEDRESAVQAIVDEAKAKGRYRA